MGTPEGMERNRHIRSHAGLRGVAALLVVAYHLQFGGAYHLAIEDATPLFRRCYLFVDLFFVLSGFILCYINDAERRDILSAGQYRRFMRRRLIRLYPLLFCTLVFMVAERALHTIAFESSGHLVWIDWSGASLAILASQFVLLNAWNPGPAGWNVPSWSISAEMVAYLLFPLIVGAWLRWPKATRTALALLAAGFYASVLAGDGSLDIIGGVAPLRCLAGFGLGMLLYSARWHIAHVPDTWLSLLQLACGAGIVIVLASSIPDPVAMPFFAGIVLATWTDRGILARLLGARVPVWLGEISYSIYLTHVCLIEVIDTVWRGPAIEDAIGSDPARIGLIAACYALVLLVSHWTFTYVEVPSRNWLGRRLLHARVGPIENSPPAP